MHNYMLDPRDYVFERCNCVLQSTYEFPCACALLVIETECDVVYLNKINQFWRTLPHVEGEDTNKDRRPSSSISY